MSEVHSPAHYTTGGIEVIDIIRAKLTRDQLIGYYYGNVLKYMLRWQGKGGVQDLEKAEVYRGWLAGVLNTKPTPAPDITNPHTGADFRALQDVVAATAGPVLNHAGGDVT
jgi:hypothetical protein